MRKRITPAELRVGMFVEEFCGSWLDHPFWRARFVVKTDAELAKVRGSEIQELWIDTSKGLDIDSPDPAPGIAEANSAAADAVAAAAAQEAAPQRTRRVDADNEFERATRILQDSHEVIADAFRNAGSGGIRGTAQAANVVATIADSVARNSSALIGLTRLKSVDDFTFLHSVSVCALMVALGRTLKLDEIEVRHAGMAGLLHDIGKARVPPAILKKTGNLDAAEMEIVRAHPEHAHTILCETGGVPPPVLDGVLHHHEKIDGSGYPHGLRGNAISRIARMCAVCDVYDTVTSNRPYKAGWQPTVAVRKMTEWAGQFDEEILKAFIKTIGIYPVGSLVRLKSQRLAVVVDVDPAQILKPTVKAFFSLRSRMHIAPELVRLDQKGCPDRILGVEDPVAHGLTRIEDLWVPTNAVFN